MSSPTPLMDPRVRETILSDPGVLLDDRDLMRALAEASDRARGQNVVDLRGTLMDRLEARLDRLEDAHRSVIAAAYDNVAGTAQIHRAVLRMLEAPTFEAFLADLSGEVQAILRVDSLRLVLEAEGVEAEEPDRVDGVLVLRPQGFPDAYLRAGREGPARDVALRPVGATSIHADGMRSEACLRLDLGEEAGLLVIGSRDERHFSPQHGTDLLAFLGAATARALRRYLG